MIDLFHYCKIYLHVLKCTKVTRAIYIVFSTVSQCWQHIHHLQYQLHSGAECQRLWESVSYTSTATTGSLLHWQWPHHRWNQHRSSTHHGRALVYVIVFCGYLFYFLFLYFFRAVSCTHDTTVVKRSKCPLIRNCFRQEISIIQQAFTTEDKLTNYWYKRTSNRNAVWWIHHLVALNQYIIFNYKIMSDTLYCRSNLLYHHANTNVQVTDMRRWQLP